MCSFLFLFLFFAIEGLEAYNVVEDIEVEINKVIEDDILDDKDIDVDSNVFIDEDIVEGNIQELGDLSSPRGSTPPHHAYFVSRTFIFSPKDFIPT